MDQNFSKENKMSKSNFKHATSCKRDSIILSLDVESTAKVIAQAARYTLVGIGSTLYLVSPSHGKVAEGIGAIKAAVSSLIDSGLDLGKIAKALAKPKKLGGRE